MQKARKIEPAPDPAVKLFKYIQGRAQEMNQNGLDSEQIGHSGIEEVPVEAFFHEDMRDVKITYSLPDGSVIGSALYSEKERTSRFKFYSKTPRDSVWMLASADPERVTIRKTNINGHSIPRSQFVSAGILGEPKGHYRSHARGEGYSFLRHE